jgi:alpha-tubulin suppressor-like RCC1 family protein
MQLQVTRLFGKGTAAVACGHSYTAAILPDGSLHTWGSGLGGQLGLGPHVVGAVWPTRVTALDGIRWEEFASDLHLICI